jgi:hypothetical protein
MVTISIVLLVTQVSSAADQELPAAVQRWQVAAKKWETLSARVQVWHYFQARHDDPIESFNYEEGNLYLEQSGVGRYQLEGLKREPGTRLQPADPESIVWSSKGTTLLDPSKKQGTFFSAEELPAFALRPDQKRNWYDISARLGDMYVQVMNNATAQRSRLPFICNRETEETLKRFDHFREDAELDAIHATPRKDDKWLRGQQLAVKFDAKSHLATAVQIEGNGRRMVIALVDVELDKHAQDREAILDNEPPGYRIMSGVPIE